MRMKSTRAAVALACSLALALSACGSDSGDGGGKDEPKLSNAAVGDIFEESDEKGGTLKMGLAGEWGDTVDTAGTYYAYSWNLLRNYARTLVMFKTEPGEKSLELTPDLATDLGQSSEGGKTWTYTLKDGAKFEDGTPITAQDIKYGILRSTDKKTFKDGPTYFDDFLDLPEGYDGPYRSKGMNTDQAIETPDEKTIIFHLKKPLANFDYFAQLPQTAPVPEAKDTGAKYQEHFISSGPYMFEGTYDPSKGFTLVRNPNWDASTDPNRKALPDTMEVQLNMNPDDLDNQIIQGNIHVDIAGAGVQPAAQQKVLTDKALMDRADNPVGTRNWYTSIVGTVKPLDNVECRKAIEYGMSSTSYQNAYGGKFAGGDIATTVMPPMIPGYEDFDLYKKKDKPEGDVEAAKEALKKCGQPDGFETTMGFRDDRPKEKAVAEAFQESLARVGIKVTPKALPSGDYFSATCGKPSYVVQNNIGLCTNGWAADWPDGFGFLSQILDSRVIRETGGSSNVSVRDPEIDKLIDQAIVEQDETKRNELWAEADKLTMEGAFIFPGVYSKSILLRGKDVTNVFVTDALGGLYDYTAMGVKQ